MFFLVVLFSFILFISCTSEPAKGTFILAAGGRSGTLFWGVPGGGFGGGSGGGGGGGGGGRGGRGGADGGGGGGVRGGGGRGWGGGGGGGRARGVLRNVFFGVI